MSTSAQTFDNTLGSLLIGLAVSAVLYGMFLAQVYTYCFRYPSDKVGYKVVIVLLLLLETTHQVFISHVVYYYSISNFLNLLALLGRPIWTLTFQLPIGALVGAIVKFLFTIRVWRFSYGNLWLVVFLMLLTFGQLALAIAYAVKSYGLLLPDLFNIRDLGIAALAIGVVNDMGIAIALCYYLQAMRSSYTKGNFLIRTLTLYAVNTGLLTSAMSFATLIVYNFMPKNLIFVGCYFVLSKLYAVTFVAALNTRQTIRGPIADSELANKLASIPGQRSHPLGIPLQAQSATVEESPSSESRGVEGSAPSSLGFSMESMRQTKPYYTVGW